MNKIIGLHSGRNYVLEILNSTYGKSEKIINDIYNVGLDIVHAKWSTLNKSNGYSYSLTGKNLENYEEHKVTKVLLYGDKGYYLIPFNKFETFLGDFKSLPEDKRNHFTINLDDHILSGGGSKLDIKDFYGGDTSIKNNINYFSYNSTKNGINDKSPKGTEEFVFDGIYINESISKINNIVFFAQHGDKPSWKPGLSAICKLTKEPYDKGYWNEPKKEKYFKVKLTPLYILPKVLDRVDFMGYFDCYDIPFIGPKLKNEANQANQNISPEQAQNIVGVLLDYFPDDIEIFNGIFGSTFSTKAQRAIIGNISKSKEPNQTLTDIKVNPIKNEPKNLILYGAPGTGKSFKLNDRLNLYFPSKELYKRITFHSNYSYRNFVGSYKPKPIYTENDKTIYNSDRITKHIHQKEPIIEYAFEPGPFIIMLERALKNPNHNFLILIEELNRANTASVFGDVFQLLDRNDSGESEYSTTLESSATDYLTSIGIKESEIKIPSNLYLWSTMNNADQGVLPLDTAFKRRWSFEHLGLNEKEKLRDGIFINFPFLDQENKLEWNKFRKVLNKKLTEMGIHEDKLIGPFFLSKTEIEDSKSVKNKLLLYLKEDILRYKSGVFKNTLSTFSLIAEEYDKGNNVFDVNLKWFE